MFLVEGFEYTVDCGDPLVIPFVHNNDYINDFPENIHFEFSIRIGRFETPTFSYETIPGPFPYSGEFRINNTLLSYAGQYELHHYGNGPRPLFEIRVNMSEL